MAIRLMFESIPIEEVFGLPPVTSPNSKATEEAKQESTSTTEGRGEGTRGERGKGTERGKGNKQRNKRVS